MATGANFDTEQQEGPFELLVHPNSTGLYEDKQKMIMKQDVTNKVKYC